MIRPIHPHYQYRIVNTSQMNHNTTSLDPPLWPYILVYLAVSMTIGIVIWWAGRSSPNLRERIRSGNQDDELGMAFGLVSITSDDSADSDSNDIR